VAVPGLPVFVRDSAALVDSDPPVFTPDTWVVIHKSLSPAVPEPSAAAVFGIGALIVGRALRQQDRSWHELMQHLIDGGCHPIPIATRVKSPSTQHRPTLT
jgi:hypothetical protein